jgi:hypothetical protein
MAGASTSDTGMELNGFVAPRIGPCGAVDLHILYGRVAPCRAQLPAHRAIARHPEFGRIVISKRHRTAMTCPCQHRTPLRRYPGLTARYPQLNRPGGPLANGT